MSYRDTRDARIAKLEAECESLRAKEKPTRAKPWLAGLRVPALVVFVALAAGSLVAWATHTAVSGDNERERRSTRRLCYNVCSRNDLPFAGTVARTRSTESVCVCGEDPGPERQFATDGLELPRADYVGGP